MTQHHITSRQNVRVKEAAKLRDRKARERQGRFVIDGARETLRAIAAGVEVVEAFVCPATSDSEEARAAVTALSEMGADVATVADEVFEKLCFGAGRDGIVAVARTPRRSLADVQVPPEGVVAVLEGIEKPGNVGAVLRSADGAGVDAVIVADGGTDLFNPNTIRASLGAVFKPNVCTATAAETLDWLRRLGLPMFAARPAATTSYAAADYRRGAALLLGSEAAGLSDLWTDPAVTPIALPMCGVADSLNVSATAAVLFYEARRQRDSGAPLPGEPA